MGYVAFCGEPLSFHCVQSSTNLNIRLIDAEVYRLKMGENSLLPRMWFILWETFSQSWRLFFKRKLFYLFLCCLDINYNFHVLINRFYRRKQKNKLCTHAPQAFTMENFFPAYSLLFSSFQSRKLFCFLCFHSGALMRMFRAYRQMVIWLHLICFRYKKAQV